MEAIAVTTHESQSDAAGEPVRARGGVVKQTRVAPSTLPVVEIFGPTVQGEGSVAGVRTHFLRMGYCDGTTTGWCTWCDTMYAVDPKNKGEWLNLSPQQIYEALLALPSDCRTLTITGGNPCIHDLDDLCRDLRMDDWTIHVETQGTIYRDWLVYCNVTVSPKPPSAGVIDDAKLLAFSKLLMQRGKAAKRDTLKIVVDPDSPADLPFAHNWVMQLRGYYDHLALSVVTRPNDTVLDIIQRWRIVVDDALQLDWHGENIRILPQLHALLWAHSRGH